MVALFTKKQRDAHTSTKCCVHKIRKWVGGPCNRMESDLTDLDPDYEFNRESFLNNVNKIMNIKYFNRIEQFMIRLYRNNLYLGYKTGNKTSPPVCHVCYNHRESRVELLLNCKLPAKFFN